MQGIEFETDKTPQGTIQYSSEVRTSLMVKWLNTIGVNDTTTANYLLLGIAATLFGIAIFMYASAIAAPKKDLAAEARAVAIMMNAR